MYLATPESQRRRSHGRFNSRSSVNESQPLPLHVVVSLRKYNFGKEAVFNSTAEQVFQDKIVIPNINVQDLYSSKRVKNYVKKEKLTPERIKQEGIKLAKFYRRIKGKKPPKNLMYEPNSFGIVTSFYSSQARLGIANILYHMYAFSKHVPVEVWVEKRDDTKELRDFFNVQFPDGRVTIRVYEDVREDVEKLVGEVTRKPLFKPFHLKVHSILASKFQYLLWVDSDAFLLKDPYTVMKQFMKTMNAAVMWHDMSGVYSGNPIYKIVNHPPLLGPSAETGVLYLNKAIAWDALLVAAYMNQRQRVYYSLVWGDKETFYLSLDYVKANYRWMTYNPYLIGNGTTFKNFRGCAFVQSDFDGYPLFLHLVSGKAHFIDFTSRGIRVLKDTVGYDPNWAHLEVTRVPKWHIVKEETKDAKLRFWGHESVLSNFEDIFRVYWNRTDPESSMSLMGSESEYKSTETKKSFVDSDDSFN